MSLNLESSLLGKIWKYDPNYYRLLLPKLPMFFRSKYEIYNNVALFLGPFIWHVYDFSYVTAHSLRVLIHLRSKSRPNARGRGLLQRCINNLLTNDLDH